MSIEARLVEAFDGLMNSPAAANTYKGDDAEYITFNYTGIPDDFGDDDAGHYRALVPTYEIVDLKNAVIKAVTLGYGREVKSAGDDEYDEGLEELRQKKTPSSGRSITA